MILGGLVAARGGVIRTHPSSAYREERTLANWANGGDLSRWAYTHPSEVFPEAMVRREGAPIELTEAIRNEIGQLKSKPLEGAEELLYHAINRGRFDCCIVFHTGKIVFEQYPAIQPNDVHLVVDLSALLLTTTAEILETQGRIDLAKPAASYVREFKETAWGEAPLRPSWPRPARGYPLAHAGLAMTLRDLARFGLLVTKSAGPEQRSTVPEKALGRLMGKTEEYRSLVKTASCSS